MRVRVTHRLVLVAAAVVFAACGGAEPRQGAGPRPGATRAGESPGDEATDLAPDFKLETFDGATFRLSDHRGTPVVLNFWESW
jgi:cytochrome oxidase Cu insertion factor (SCO1/SenC/PrrC family)